MDLGRSIGQIDEEINRRKMIEIIEQAKSEYRQDIIINGPVSRKIIDSAEKYLGLSLPESYRDFVNQYGNFVLYGIEIYGIIDSDFDGSLIFDGVRATRVARQELQLPNHLYVIANIDGDELHCLDCSKAPYSLVVAWDTYGRSIINRLSNSFSSYLDQRIRWAMSLE